jgi:uncharacterized protein YecE (DUF72 family)
LFAGTSGFAYPGWAPVFYPPGTGAKALLPAYAERLPACELNSTFRRQATPALVAGWSAATPAGFRFAVKAQRGGSLRALLSDPDATLPWLIGPLRGFGERLGSVLFRVPAEIERDEGRLERLLAAWPRDVPLTFEFQHPSWVWDDVLALLSSVGAALCATDLDDAEAPTIRLTAPFLYLRLRRASYSPGDLGAWADRIAPFLDAGHDVFAFFRHDETGESALRAIELGRLAGAIVDR